MRPEKRKLGQVRESSWASVSSFVQSEQRARKIPVMLSRPACLWVSQKPHLLYNKVYCFCHLARTILEQDFLTNCVLTRTWQTRSSPEILLGYGYEHKGNTPQTPKQKCKNTKSLFTCDLVCSQTSALSPASSTITLEERPSLGHGIVSWAGFLRVWF